MTNRFRPLHELPLFASEEAIATAHMGTGQSRHWKQIAPLLERRGFPTIDGLMGGRYTPANREYGVHGSLQVSEFHQPANLGASWKRA